MHSECILPQISKEIGFKIQGSEKTSWILNLESSLDSRILFRILNLESWILPPWIQEVFSEPWILNLESYTLGFKNSFWDLESWILNPTSLDSRSFFLSLESWILNPTSLDSRSFFWALNLESWILPPWIQEFFLGSWILNLGPFAQDFSATLGSWIFDLGKNAFWMHSLQNPQKIELKKPIKT